MNRRAEQVYHSAVLTQCAREPGDYARCLGRCGRPCAALSRRARLHHSRRRSARHAGDGGGLARHFIHPRTGVHAADARWRHPGAFLSSGPADATHAAADPGRASRRHQRIASRGARRRSRRHRLRRADRCGSRPAAIQDHAAGHRHHRRRGALDERSSRSSAPTARSASSASAFPGASRSSPPGANRSAIAWPS